MKRYLRNNLLVIGIIVSIVSCNKNMSDVDLKGSWYYLSEDGKSYREIHIDDSLFVPCSDNADIVVPFLYQKKKDSVILMVDKNNVYKKYQIEMSSSGEISMLLISKYDSVLYRKMEFTIKNINHIFIDYNSLDSFCYEFIKRRNKRFNEYESRKNKINEEFITICKLTKDTIRIDYLDLDIKLKKGVNFVSIGNLIYKVDELEYCKKVYSGKKALEELKKNIIK